MGYNNSDWLPTGSKYNTLKKIFKRHTCNMCEGLNGTDRFLIIKASDTSLENEIRDIFKSITLKDAVQIMGYSDYGFSDSFKVCEVCNRVLRIEDLSNHEFWYDCEKGSYFCNRNCMNDQEITSCIDQAKLDGKNVVYWRMVSRDDLKDRDWFKIEEQYNTKREVPKELNEKIRTIFSGADVLYYMTKTESQYYTIDVWIKNIAVRSDQVFELIQEVINERVKTLERNRERALEKNYMEKMLYSQRESELSTMTEELLRLKRRMHRLIEKHVKESIK